MTEDSEGRRRTGSMTSTPRVFKAAVAAALAPWFFAPAADAQGLVSTNGASAAEALFQQARELMKNGRFGEACPKLQESNRLDPGLGTRMNLAECWHRIGRSAAAYNEFSAVADAAQAKGEHDRAEAARRHAASLEPQLSKLIISVPPASRVPGLAVRRDEALVTPDQWDRPVLVDPGKTTVAADAPGRYEWRSELTLVAGGEAERVSIPVLFSEPTRLAPNATTQPDESNTARGLWLRRIGVGVAAAGVVGIGVGTYFGIRAIQLHDRSNEEGCDSDNRCPAPAFETRNQAIDAGNAATVAFAAGAVLTLTGAGLFVWGSQKSSGSIWARGAVFPDGSARAVIDGRF